MNKFLTAQYKNIALFAPLVMALGIGLYFALPFEPVVRYSLIITILCAVNFFIIIKKREKFSDNLFVIYSGVLLFAFGFFYAMSYTRLIDTNTIHGDIRSAVITGTISEIDYLPDKSRVVLTDTNIKSDYAENKKFEPIKIRATLMDGITPPNIGSTITAHGALFKPAPADVPGGFDFSEWAYFQGIGATGYITEITSINSKNITTFPSVSKIRDIMHNRAAQSNDLTGAMLVDSLVLGYNHAVPQQENESIKTAGISHVFSISGYHMALIGGWFYAIFYLLFRLVAPLSRRFPSAKLAIIPTLLCLVFYLAISGASVATVRAFLMAIIAFAALAFSRNPFSLRTASIVFGAVLLLNPHNLMTAGFQLSFAAVFGILFYFSNRKNALKSRFQKLMFAIFDLLMASVIATIFTAPFIAYHFQTLQIYGVLGNLLCVPIFSVIIMPLVLIGAVAAFFGVFFPLHWATYFYQIVLDITNYISGLPAAKLTLPYIPGLAFILCILGLLAIVFISTERKYNFVKYLFCTACFGAAFLITTTREKPIFYVSADHELVAFMKDDGNLQFNRGKSSKHKMTFAEWESFNGTNNENHKSIRKGFNGKNFSVTCDKQLCFYKTPKWTLAYSAKFIPLMNNINKVFQDNDFIVSVLKITSEKYKDKIIKDGALIYKDKSVKYISNKRYWHNKNYKYSADTK